MTNKTDGPNAEVDSSTLLAEWSETYEKLRTEYDALRKIFDLSPECKMSNAMHGMFECYTRALALLVGDDCGWLEWYAWENDNGTSGMQAKAENWKEGRKIRNTEDLLSLIANNMLNGEA